MTWQVIAAVLAAWCVAVGAAAQEQPATAVAGGAVGRIGMVGRLLRSPRWLLGGLITIVGMVLHAAALATAPLSIVQPLGISGLLVAVWIAARWRRRRLTRREIAGALAVSLGLIGLIWSLPGGGGTAPQPADSHLMALSLVAVPLAVSALTVGRLLESRWRAGVLAVIAGMSFGVTAALVRVIATDLANGWSALWHWRSGVALVLVSVGGLVLQNAYRAGHFGLSYALLLVVDPVVAAGIGLVFLAEPLPATTGTVVTACLSTAVTVAGVFALAGTTREPVGDHRARGRAQPSGPPDAAAFGIDDSLMNPFTTKENPHVRPTATYAG